MLTTGWKPIFAGSHPSAVQALVNEKVTAAATYEGNLLNMREEGIAEVCGFEEERVGVPLSQERLEKNICRMPRRSPGSYRAI